jgi:putative membrane protein
MTSNLRQEIQDGEVSITEALAAERTMLADERTFLAYFRTAIASGISGGSLLEFFTQSIATIFLGWFLVILSFILFFWGLIRYFAIRRLIPWAEWMYHPSRSKKKK